MKISALVEAFNLDEEDAKMLLRIIRYKVNPMSMPERFPRTCESYYYLHLERGDTDNEMRLSALDELLETCGVEAIRTTEFIDHYHGDTRASYLNTGDSYTPTILLDHRDLRWRLTSWCDFVESIDGTKDANGEPIEVL